MLFSAGFLLAASHVFLRNKETASESCFACGNRRDRVWGGAWFPKKRCPGAIEMFKVIWLPLQSAVNLF